MKWLGAGAVTVGLGAAMTAGQGLVFAPLASADDSASAESSNNDTTTESTADASASDPSGTETNSKPDTPSSTVSASTVEVTKDDDAEEDPPTSGTETAVEEPVVEEESGGDDATVVELEPTATPVPEPSGKSDSPAVAAVETGSDYSADTPAAVLNSTPTAQSIETSSTTRLTRSTVSDTATTDPVPDVDELASSTTSMVMTTLAAAAAEPIHQPAFLQGPITLRNIVTDVLTWLGFGPLATNLPIEPAPLPPPLESLWLVVRRFGYTLLNQTPAAQATISGQDMLTGVVTGKINATDYDDDHLTFTVTGAPAHGTVTVDAAGNFVYTPTAALAEAGGQDEFTVTIDDRPGNPWHIHGLFDVLGFVPDTTATVKVTVAPINHLPAVTITPTGQPNPTTGAITYQVQVTDPDPGDTPIVAVTDAPDHGTLVRNMDGTYTYTPNYEYAHDIPPGQTGSDSFTITANDGRGGIDTETEQIAVPFLNTAPTGTAVVGQPDPETGIVTGGFMVGDAPDGDPLTYTLTSGGAKAVSIIVDPNTGAWSYTPGETARLTAAAVNASAADKQDTFVVTVSDGFTATPITVTVPVIAPDNTVIGAIAAGFAPRAVAVSPDGTRAYVTNMVDGVGNVSIIDTTTNTVVRNIPVGGAPIRVALSLDGTRLYVTGTAADTVAVVDTENFTVTPVTVGSNPHDVAIHPDGTYAYVTNESSGTVSVIDVGSSTVIATFLVDDFLGDVEFSPDGAYAYIVDIDERAVRVVDTNTRTLVTTVNGIGLSPHGMAVSPDGKRVYVANTLDNTVSVIDTDLDAVVATVNVGDDPWGVVASPDGTRVYVSNISGGTVSVIDAAVNTVVDEIQVGAAPRHMAISADGTHLYVAMNVPGGTVMVISIVPGTPAAPVVPPQHSVATVEVGAAVDGVAVSPDGSLAYAVHSASDKVSVIDTATNQVIATIDVGDSPNDVVLSPDGATAYVTNTGDDSVSVIDTSSRQVIKTIGVGDAPWDLAVNPDGTRVYVANLGTSGTVSVIDTGSNEIIATINTTDALAVAFSPDGTYAYITNFGTDTLSVIDTATYGIIANIMVGDAPAGVAVSPDGGHVYVTNTASDTVSVIDTAAGTVVVTLNVGDFSADVAVSPDGKYVYVGNVFSDTVSVIDAAANTVVATIVVGDGPADVVFSPDGSRLYIPSSGSGIVSVIAVEQMTPIAAKT
jgi:YVTN family beta-propeller protein/VCBS repeat-containing protein